MGRVRSKKSKYILARSCGVGLKSCPISTPPPLWDGENPRGVKQGEVGQVGRGKITILSPHMASCGKNCGLFLCPYHFPFMLLWYLLIFMI